MDARAVAMQCNACLHGRDAGPGDAPSGASPGPSMRQRFAYVFSFSVFIRSAFWGKEMGCTGVCIVPRGMLRKVTQQTVPVKTP